MDQMGLSVALQIARDSSSPVAHCLADAIDRVRALAAEWETTGGLAGAAAAERLHAAIGDYPHPVDEGLRPCPCSHPPTWAACKAAGCTCHDVVPLAARR
jgi:hypothetical protein